MTTFWEIAAHSVDHLFSVLSKCLFVILFISHFGFEGWIWVLIASVPDLCIYFTSTLYLLDKADTSHPDTLGLVEAVPFEVKPHHDKTYYSAFANTDQGLCFRYLVQSLSRNRERHILVFSAIEGYLSRAFFRK